MNASVKMVLSTGSAGAAPLKRAMTKMITFKEEQRVMSLLLMIMV